MEYFKEFIKDYAPSMIHATMVFILSCLSYQAKKIYQKYIEDKTKKEVTKSVCHAIEMLYPKISSSEKLNKATQNIQAILKEKGIMINSLELRMYIEETVYHINKKESSLN